MTPKHTDLNTATQKKVQGTFYAPYNIAITNTHSVTRMQLRWDFDYHG